MSNRSIAFLILVFFCSALIYLVYYFFIANVWILTVNTWIDKKVIVTINSEFRKSYSKVCFKTCEFSKIPPINYNLEAISEGYKNFNYSLNLRRQEKLTINLKLEKLVVANNIEKTNKDKILELKLKNTIKDDEKFINYKIISSFRWKIYFYSGSKLYFFSWDEVKELFSLENENIESIINNDIDELFLIMTKNSKYLYDINSDTNYIINLDSKISFIKKTLNDDKFIILADDWVYLYSISSSESIRNTLYDDYAQVGSSLVIWLIKKDSNNKLKLLNFENNGKDKIILHNIENKERKIIFETQDIINYVIYWNWGIFLVSNDWKILKLNNIELK